MARNTITKPRISPVSRALLNRFADAAKDWGAALDAQSQQDAHRYKQQRYEATRGALEARILRLERAAAKQSKG